MMKKTFRISVTIAFLSAAVAAIDIPSDTTACQPLNVHDSAMVLLINQNYPSARSLLADHLSRDSLDMNARYLLFAIEQTRILDYESYMVEHREFQVLADSIKGNFEKRIVHLHGIDSTICLFYLANVIGGIGVMQAKTGNWFDGVKNAINSVSLLKMVKKRDPSFFAADLGIGIFNYYLSTGFKWLPFVENKEQEGLNAIKSAFNADFPYNYAAKNSLCWILIERNNFRQADSIAQAVLDKYPDNTIFLRIKALVALWTGNYANALQHGKRLVALTEKRTPQNWSDLVAGYTVLVQSYDELGKKTDACAAARKLLEGEKIPSEYLEIPHIKKNVRYINGIRQKCKKGRL